MHSCSREEMTHAGQLDPQERKRQQSALARRLADPTGHRARGWVLCCVYCVHLPCKPRGLPAGAVEKWESTTSNQGKS